MTNIRNVFAPAMVLFALTAASLTPPAASAQSDAAKLPALSLGQQTSLRCASAFAIVSALQDRGGAQEYPALGKRGREYFVRTMARLMDETGATRAQLQQMLQAEVRTMEDPALVSQIMPPCLALLEQSGL